MLVIHSTGRMLERPKTTLTQDKNRWKTLTADAGAEEHFQNQVSFVVKDGSCCHGNESKSQVLDGLHAVDPRQKTDHGFCQGKTPQAERHFDNQGQCEYIQAIGRPQLVLRHHKCHHGPQCTGQQRVGDAQQGLENKQGNTCYYLIC